ncbi:hypothetical protein JZ751_006842, partial [Albula glossodonta]
MLKTRHHIRGLKSCPPPTPRPHETGPDSEVTAILPPAALMAAYGPPCEKVNYFPAEERTLCLTAREVFHSAREAGVGRPQPGSAMLIGQVSDTLETGGLSLIPAPPAHLPICLPAVSCLTVLSLASPYLLCRLLVWGDLVCHDENLKTAGCLIFTPFVLFHPPSFSICSGAQSCGEVFYKDTLCHPAPLDMYCQLSESSYFQPACSGWAMASLTACSHTSVGIQRWQRGVSACECHVPWHLLCLSWTGRLRPLLLQCEGRDRSAPHSGKVNVTLRAVCITTLPLSLCSAHFHFYSKSEQQNKEKVVKRKTGKEGTDFISGTASLFQYVLSIFEPRLAHLLLSLFDSKGR